MPPPGFQDFEPHIKAALPVESISRGQDLQAFHHLRLRRLFLLLGSLTFGAAASILSKPFSRTSWKPRNLLSEAIRIAAPETPFIYIATDKSFGEQELCGFGNSLSGGFSYETSKACEDFLVESYRKTYGLRICLLRFPNFFGEGDLHLERLVPTICEAAAKQTELVIQTRLDGTTQAVYWR